MDHQPETVEEEGIASLQEVTRDLAGIAIRSLEPLEGREPYGEEGTGRDPRGAVHR